VVETVSGGPEDEGVVAAAQLLHDFNVEYDDPAPSPGVLASRLAWLIGDGHAMVLLVRTPGDGAAVGVAVLRVQPSVMGPAQEAYLAEVYVVPDRRGQGFGGRRHVRSSARRHTAGSVRAARIAGNAHVARATAARSPATRRTTCPCRCASWLWPIPSTP